MLTLAGYFDESGTHAGSPAVSVAGYFSTPEQWQAFETDWMEALDDFGILRFHRTEFANKAKAFASWTDSQRRERFLRLVAIINRHVIASVGFALSNAEFDANFSEKAKRLTGGAYELAAVCCLMQAARLLDSTFPSTRIRYVFERGAAGAGQVLKVFRMECQRPRSEGKTETARHQTGRERGYPASGGRYTCIRTIPPSSPPTRNRSS